MCRQALLLPHGCVLVPGSLPDSEAVFSLLRLPNITNAAMKSPARRMNSGSGMSAWVLGLGVPRLPT